jgi:hypothetical protein
LFRSWFAGARRRFSPCADRAGKHRPERLPHWVEPPGYP